MADRHARTDYRGRGPRGYVHPDERIAEEAIARLTDDPALDASDIEVSVTGGEVTLTGTVADRRDRRRAEDLVEGILGVSYVQNNLRLQGAGFGADEPWSMPGRPTDAGRVVTVGSVAGTDRAVTSTEAPSSAPHAEGPGIASEGPASGSFHATPRTQTGP
jgi:hypothetical protein